jgi:hypothetical protein
VLVQLFVSCLVSNHITTQWCLITHGDVKIFFCTIIYRFYLGLALALQKEGPGARVKEAVSYLLEAKTTVPTLYIIHLSKCTNTVYNTLI